LARERRSRRGDGELGAVVLGLHRENEKEGKGRWRREEGKEEWGW
jgi:hypothetical protein